MIFVTGPLFSGKRTFVKNLFGWDDDQLRRNAVLDAQDLAASEGLETLASRLAASASSPEAAAERPVSSEGSLEMLADRLAASQGSLETLADRLASQSVVIASEIGGGVVPLDPDQRAAREKAGRLACLLAERADIVVRMCCGLPEVLKGDLSGCTGSETHSKCPEGDLQ